MLGISKFKGYQLLCAEMTLPCASRRAPARRTRCRAPTAHPAGASSREQWRRWGDRRRLCLWVGGHCSTTWGWVDAELMPQGQCTGIPTPVTSYRRSSRQQQSYRSRSGSTAWRLPASRYTTISSGGEGPYTAVLVAHPPSSKPLPSHF